MIPPVKTILDDRTAENLHSSDGPMTPKQARRLQILCAELMQEYDESLTEAQAHERIEALEQMKSERKDPS